MPWVPVSLACTALLLLPPALNVWVNGLSPKPDTLSLYPMVLGGDWTSQNLGPCTWTAEMITLI